MANPLPDHYAALGLDRNCSDEQIRSAYRILAKRFHPDVNPDSAEAAQNIQAINAAYEILSDPAQRSAYDEERAQAPRKSTPKRASKLERNVAQDVQLRIDEFIRGTSLDVKVIDPGNPDGPEIYQLTIPAETAPGARFRIPREGGGVITVRARALPGFQFKVRGSDLRCDLKIHAKRATQGGYEMLRGANGAMIRVNIPAGIARGETIRIEGEGLPRPRGGRGDLLVRVMYRPEVKITRSSRY